MRKCFSVLFVLVFVIVAALPAAAQDMMDDEAMMDEGEMMMDDMMVVLEPGAVADEPAECADLRASVESFLYDHFSQAMMMMEDGM